MPQSLLQRIKETFPKTKLIQTFGTSETGISQTTSRSSTSTLIKFDDSNTEYKIVDGELWLRSKSQILGYLNHEMSRFTEDRWFKTGDLLEHATQEEGEGFFRIVGRKQEIINVGGEKLPHQRSKPYWKCLNCRLLSLCRKQCHHWTNCCC